MAENPELALWRAVLVAGLEDAARAGDVDWLGSPDFEEVCHLAQMDPDAVLRAYRPERHKVNSKAPRPRAA